MVIVFLVVIAGSGIALVYAYFWVRALVGLAAALMRGY